MVLTCRISFHEPQQTDRGKLGGPGRCGERVREPETVRRNTRAGERTRRQAHLQPSFFSSLKDYAHSSQLADTRPVPFTAEEKRGVTRACIAVLCHILADIKVGLPAAGAAIGEVAEIEHPGDEGRTPAKAPLNSTLESGNDFFFFESGQYSDTCISF